jgi:hypothetical protein
MSKKEEKALTPKPPQQNTMTTQAAAEYEFDDASTMFNFRDLIIPKILVMQGLSKLVASGDAKMGDIVDTERNEVIGNVREKDQKPIRFYPLQMFRYWVKRTLDEDGEMQFDSAMPWTPQNADLDWDIMDGAKKVGVNEETIVFAVVRKDQLDNLDQPPRLLSFRKTSLKQTKAIKHHFFMCMSTRKEVPFQTEFELSGVLDKNEKGQSWYLPEVLPKDKASDGVTEQLMAFYKRYGKAIKEKIAGLLDDDADLGPASQGAEVAGRDVSPKPVEVEGPRAKF